MNLIEFMGGYMNDKINSITHELKLIDRNILSLSGISKIVSFDDLEFIIEGVMGAIHIKGEGLELLNLDTTEGNIKIKGKINGINYIEKIGKKKDESFIAKLFK